mgnify:CR=1
MKKYLLYRLRIGGLTKLKLYDIINTEIVHVEKVQKRLDKNLKMYYNKHV